MKKYKSLLSLMLVVAMLFSLSVPTALALSDEINMGYGLRIIADGPSVPGVGTEKAPIGPALLTFEGGSSTAGINVMVQAKAPASMDGVNAIWFILKYDNTKLTLMDYQGKEIKNTADSTKGDGIAKDAINVVATKAVRGNPLFDVMNSDMVTVGNDTYCYVFMNCGLDTGTDKTENFTNMAYLSFKLNGCTETDAAKIKDYAQKNLSVNSISIADTTRSPGEAAAINIVTKVGASVAVASKLNPTTGRNPAFYNPWTVSGQTKPVGIHDSNMVVDYPGMTNVAPYTITTLAPTFQVATPVTVPVVLPAAGTDVVRQTAVVVTDSTTSTQHTLPTNAVWSLAYSATDTGAYAPLTESQKAFISMDAKTGAITVKAGAPAGFLKATVTCGNTVASDGTATGTEVAGTTASLELTRAAAAVDHVKLFGAVDSVITIPKDAAKKVTYKALGINQYNEEMPTEAVTWTLNPLAANGVSLEDTVPAANGSKVVAVAVGATAKDYTLKASTGAGGTLKEATYNIKVTLGTPTANIPTAKGDVTLDPKGIKDDSGSYTADGTTTMTLPTGTVWTTVTLTTGTVITPVNPTGDKATQLELTGGPVSLPAGGLVTLTPGSKITVNLDGSAVLPANSTILVGGKTLTLVSGATVAADGTITIPSGGIVMAGTPEATITYPTGGGTVPPNGVVKVPEGGTIAVGGSTVTVGKPEATVDPNGEIKIPTGGSATIGTPATTLKPPAGGSGTIVIDTNGNVTNAPGGAVTMPDGSTITPPAGGSVVIDKAPGDTAKVPGGSTITNDKGNSTVKVPDGQNNVTIDNNGDIKVPANGTVEVGKPATTVKVPAAPATTTINPGDTGKVELPTGSEITQPSGDKVTTGGGNTTLNPDGSVTIPGGSTVTDKNGNTSTPTAPGGGTLKPDGTVDMPTGGTVTGTTPKQDIVVTAPGSVIVDDKGNITLPGGGTVTTVPNGAITVPGGGSIANDGSVTYPKDQPATSGTGDTVVTPPTGGSVVVKPDGSITVTDKDTVSVPGTGNITLPEGGKVNADGSVTTVPDGSITTPGGSVVKPGAAPNNTVTVTPGGDGTITVPGGGTVTQPDGGQIVLPGGGSLKPDGGITSDKPVKIPGMGGKDEITVTPGTGGSVTIDKDGNIEAGTGGSVTLPGGGGTVTVTPPNKIEVGVGGGVTLPGGGTITGGGSGTITVKPGETVQPGGGITPVPGTDVKVGDTGIVVKPGDKNVSATTNPDKSVTVPNGGIISIPAKAPNPAVEIKLPQGGSIDKDGTITVPVDGSVTLGGTTVKPATGETITIENSGKVVLPDGTTVTPGGGSASIVVNPTGDTELKPDGSVTFPNGGTVTVGGQTVTIPDGAVVDNMGNITLPANGIVTLPSGVTVTPAAGGKVVILPDGTVKLPQGGTKNPGATSVGAGGSVSIDGTVTQPSNPGGGGSGGGTVTPPAKSESVTITVKADGNGVATVDDAALKNALETAAKSGATTVVIDAGGKTIALTQPQLKMLADNKNIQNVEFKTPLYRLRLDKSAQMSVAAETKGKITVSFSDGMNLDPETKVQQGKAPVAEVTLTSENGAVTKLGGTGTIFFNYTLKAGETADMLTGLYLPKNATAQRLPARYDAKMKMAEVDTTHLSVFSFTFDTMRFSDVKGWASDYIYHLANRGVVKGVTADMYMPEANVTRSEFVTLLARMSGAKLPAGTTKFMDVAADAWYAPSVAWAVSAGITKGTGEGYFNPDMPISRQDMAAMLARYTQHMGRQPDKAAEAMTFADAASIAPYAVEAVTLMQQAGVINGRDGGNFAPMANATRGECAKMMSALLYAID